MARTIYIEDYVMPTGSDQTAEVQAVLDGAPEESVFDFGRGDYHCHQPINLTHREGFTFRGGTFNHPAIISHAQGCAAIDLVGSRYYRFDDFHLRGDDAQPPAVAFLSARTPSYLQVSECVFRDVYVRGKFTASVWYGIDTELVTLDHCGTQEIVTPYVYYVSNANDHGLTSYLPIDERPAYNSVTQHFISACTFGVAAGQDTTIIRLGNDCSGIRVRDSYWVPRGAGYGVEIAGTLDDVVLSGCTQEGGTVFCHIGPNHVVIMLTIENCRFAKKIIEMEAGSFLYRSAVRSFQSMAKDGELGLDLYNASTCEFHPWWAYPSAKMEATYLTSCDVCVPAGNLTVHGASTDCRIVEY